MKSSTPPEHIKLLNVDPETLQDLNCYSQDDLLTLAVEVLHKVNSERNKADLKILNHALKEVIFFKKLIVDRGEDLFKQCINRIKHQQMQKDEVVCRVGQPGRTFYVIMSGSVGVSVMVSKENKTEDKKPQDKKSAGKKNMLIEEMEYTEVTVLRSGSYFGELALLNDAPRTATITCKEKCNFAVLDREDFKEILAQHTNWQIQQDIKFFSSLPLFSKINKRGLSTLIYHFKLLKLARKTVIFREGEESTHLYIIKSGEVTISKGFTQQKQDFEEPEKANVSSSRKPIKRNIELAILGPKEIFGEEDLYNGVNRQISAVCASAEVELYAIEKKDFKRRIRSTEEFFNYFQDHCKNKLELRDNRIQFITDTVEQKKEQIWGTKQNTSNPSPSSRSNSKNTFLKAKGFKQAHQQRQTNISTFKIPLPSIDSSVRSISLEKSQPNIQVVLPDFSGQKKNGTKIEKKYNLPPSVLLGSAASTPKGSNHSDIFFQTQFGPVEPKRTQSLPRPSPQNPSIETSRRSIMEGQIKMSPFVSKAIRSSKNATTLFEKKAFEVNQMRALNLKRPRNSLLNNSFEVTTNISKIKATHKVTPKATTFLKPDKMNRSYITNRQTYLKREQDIQNDKIKAQEDLLNTKFKVNVDEDSILVDFLQETPTRRPKTTQVKKPQSIENTVSVMQRFRNLPTNRLNEPKLQKDPYMVNNIHMNSKRGQSYLRDVFHAQTKILNHFNSCLVSKNNSPKQSPVNRSTHINPLRDQINRSAIGLVRARSRHVSVSTNKIVDEPADHGVNYRFLDESVYNSMNNSITEFPEDISLAVRSLRGRNTSDLL